MEVVIEKTIGFIYLNIQISYFRKIVGVHIYWCIAFFFFNIQSAANIRMNVDLQL